jgi:hypothetical protein
LDFLLPSFSACLASFLSSFLEGFPSSAAMIG